MRFEPGVDRWRSRLGATRDAVRQELVRRQLAAHLPTGTASLQALDAGCGQGTQALALARLGHHVVGADLSRVLLDQARAAAAQEPEVVCGRVRFVEGDVLALGPGHAARYDVVCCRGVAMYLPSLDETIRALLGACRSGAVVSLLTRNRAGIAMRAGMTGDWVAARAAFDVRYYNNRLGIQAVRADEPAEVAAAFEAAGASVVAWYGVRLFTDHWAAVDPPTDFEDLIAAEEEAGRRDPYRALAALTHTIAMRS